jgi:cellulose synthase operon protein C
VTRLERGLLAAVTLLLALGAGGASLPQPPSPTPPRVPPVTFRPPAKLGALEALRRGQYPRALEAGREELAKEPANPGALDTLVRALLETGGYGEAEETVRSFLTRNPKVADAQALLGDVLVVRGKRGEAEAAYGRAIASRASTRLSAEASLGALLYDRGLRAEATVRFERLITAYNTGLAKTASDLIAVARACRFLGALNPDAFKDALKALDEAAALDQTHEARIRTGDLFLEKFNGTEARNAFEIVLRTNRLHPQALLGLARARDFDGESGVPDLLDAALAANPNLTEARAYRSGLFLALEDFQGARAEAEKALESNPVSPDALAALAAAQYLTGEAGAFAATSKLARTLYPRRADLLVDVAEAAVRNRLYRDAARLATEALTQDPQSWPALASLGQNQLRLGEIDEARKNLERSFAGDPYNVWVKNTLDLLDTFPNYTTTETGAFRLFLHRKEAGVLGPPMTALAKEAMKALSARYGYSSGEPVRIEAYPSHADFSVRTVGLAGLGALGVCFGPVVAIDSPQARDRGAFNWGSTLWHELAHVVTLGVSGNRVPRWLTEGISVHEERRARPGWGDDLSLEFLLAYQQGEILALRDLNNGFVRPKHPGQVSLSYYQASLVVEHIEGRHGIAGLRNLLLAYGTGASTEEAFRSALSRSVDEVDREFHAALKTRLSGPLAVIRAPARASAQASALPETRAALEARVASDENDFIAHTLLGRLNHREKRPAEALRYLERAARLWPESAGDESPYFPIAEIKLARGDTDGAIEALRSLVARNENHDAARLKLAELLEGKGRVDEALSVLETSVFIFPFDQALHERRAALAARTAKTAVARDARAAIVELDPVDKAEAHFQLALAELDAGDRGAARRSLLRSLEMAPRFGRAQELLLKLHREDRKPK